jgi:hypothetical protein
MARGGEGTGWGAVRLNAEGKRLAWCAFGIEVAGAVR